MGWGIFQVDLIVFVLLIKNPQKIVFLRSNFLGPLYKFNQTQRYFVILCIFWKICPWPEMKIYSEKGFYAYTHKPNRLDNWPRAFEITKIRVNLYMRGIPQREPILIIFCKEGFDLFRIQTPKILKIWQKLLEVGFQPYINSISKGGPKWHIFLSQIFLKTFDVYCDLWWNLMINLLTCYDSISRKFNPYFEKIQSTSCWLRIPRNLSTKN